MNQRARELISKLSLEPHPEGGYYRRVFQSAAMVTTGDGRGQRHAMTSIYFLLTNDAPSSWHQVKSDEAWHLYEGGPLTVFELDPSTGELSENRLAQYDAAHPEASEARLVHVVAAENWQAARCDGEYALMGCTVAPGFDFADFRLLSSDSAVAKLIRAQRPELLNYDAQIKRAYFKNSFLK